MKQSFNEVFHLINKYSRKSVFYIYLKRLFLIVSIPLLIVLSVTFYFNRLTLNNELQYSASKTMEAAWVSGNNLLDEISNNYLLYNENNYVQMFMNTSSDKFLQFNSLFSNRILDRITMTTQSSNYIHSVSLCSFSAEYIYSNTGGHYINANLDVPWYDYYLKTNVPNFTVSSEKDDTFFVSYGCYSNKKLGGLIVFEIKQSALRRLLLGNSKPEKNRFYFADEENNILYATSKEQNIDYVWKGFSENGSFFRKKNELVFKKPFEARPDITLLYIHNSENINSAAKRINMLFIICIIICLVSPLLIAFYVSFKLFKSLTEIIAVLNVGDVENKAELNEFTFISSHIMELLDKNANAESELMKKTAAFKQAQSIAYQSQFSPHFLFNTLNIISLTSRVMFKGSNKIEKIVSLLSELLAAAINTKDYIVTTDEELGYAKTYIEIQKLRCKDDFDVTWDIDEELLTVNTVKLILQPLIENVFFHGFSTLETRRGLLKISAKSENDSDMYFCVSDNGEMIPPDRLEEIRKTLSRDDILHKNHIGLSNVNTRIKTVFGEKYGVEITSDENGTSVFVTFPKK